MKKFPEIIGRVEEVRGRLGLNKSRFVGAFDMTPQTYNNFIGTQGSKPNIELVCGIVERFKVDPYWLLSGSGEPFVEGVEPERVAAEAMRASAEREHLSKPDVMAREVQVQKFSQIIERVEEVRGRLGLNKSRFAGALKMKPQTYNNFIVPQGSKPNIELVHGMVEQFKVNPHWLLNGSGQPFQEGADLEGIAGAARGSGQAAQENWEDRGALGRELQALKPMNWGREKVLQGVAADHRSLDRVLRPLLAAHLRLDPVSAIREIRMFVEQIKTRVAKLTPPSK